MLSMQANIGTDGKVLTFGYVLTNASAVPVFVMNRYAESDVHPDCIEVGRYTSASASVFRSSSGEVLIFQGMPRRSQMESYRHVAPRASVVPHGGSVAVRGGFKLPVRQSSCGSKPPQDRFVPADRVRLVVEVRWEPETIQALDGTDAVFVRSEKFQRLIAETTLPRPVLVGVDDVMTDWGDTYERMIRLGADYYMPVP